MAIVLICWMPFTEQYVCTKQNSRNIYVYMYVKKNLKRNIYWINGVKSSSLLCLWSILWFLLGPIFFRFSCGKAFIFNSYINLMVNPSNTWRLLQFLPQGLYRDHFFSLNIILTLPFSSLSGEDTTSRRILVRQEETSHHTPTLMVLWSRNSSIQN